MLSAMQMSFLKSCAAASEKLQCDIEKAALQESGAFLPLSCGFQAPTFWHPRLGPADFMFRLLLGERQSIAKKSVRAIDARNSWLENGSNAAKTSLRAPGLSTDEREHPFV